MYRVLPSFWGGARRGAQKATMTSKLSVGGAANCHRRGRAGHFRLFIFSHRRQRHQQEHHTITVNNNNNNNNNNDDDDDDNGQQWRVAKVEWPLPRDALIRERNFFRPNNWRRGFPFHTHTHTHTHTYTPSQSSKQKVLSGPARACPPVPLTVCVCV